MMDLVATELGRLHERIAGRFGRAEPRARVREYVSGLVTGLERKNGWTLAEWAGEVSPDGMQRLLRRADWDVDGVRDDIRAYVVEQLGEPDGVLIADDTGFLKKGTRSAGVQRQYSGTAGRTEMSELSAPVLAVQDLHREFGGVHAVNGASFTVPPGRITGLIVPNGAGKSTALNIIAGALKPSAGTVSYQGKDITGLPAYKVARRGIIRTFQLSSEFAALTVLENLLVAAPAQRGEALWQAALGKRYWRPQERAMVERARQLLARFDMSAKEDEYAGNLSGGQKRLLELMRGLMANPALLLLDEPMAGVNPSLARRIEQHLADLVGEGLTMLMIEHELAVVERLCDPVVVMAQGRVISQGTMANIRSDQEVLDAYLIG